MRKHSERSLKSFSRIVCIVLDGVGVGQAPDADRYGDVGSNSLGNTATHVGSLRLPMLERMGLGCITAIDGVPPVEAPIASFGKMTPAAAGKDSVTGHWELMGCLVEQPFPTYPNGFPDDVVTAFERSTGRRVLGNRTASGTVIIRELGETHLKTGHPIVYTSQDSVFQIAAHESVVPVEQLYRWCKSARDLLIPPHGVARVIARPFSGSPGGFFRTPRRRDFSLPPVRRTVLDALISSGRTVRTIGKIHDLFAARRITEAVSTNDNRQGMAATLDAVGEKRWSLIFTNLVDFDTMWGHRNDTRAYALGLEEFDSYLNALLPALDEETLLIITSDHGNDPTTPSTDHSREYVPLIVYHRGLTRPVDLGVRGTFADVGRTVAENFGIEEPFPGKSFLGCVSQ